MKKLYYIQDSRAFIDNSPLWWAKDGKSYTTHISKAKKFPEYQARNICKYRNTDKAWPVEYIDSISTPAIAVQNMDQCNIATFRPEYDPENDRSKDYFLRGMEAR